jgi:hypothetical protein
MYAVLVEKQQQHNANQRQRRAFPEQQWIALQ